MNLHCLNEEELRRFIEIVLYERDVYDDEEIFNCLLENWKTWDVEFICLATVFSRFLEQQLKRGQRAELTLSKIFSMDEKTGHWLTLEGFSEEFVKYFFRHTRDENLTIDDDLNYLRTRFGEHEY